MRNTHIVINEVGELTSTYEKCHLFDVNIPEKGIRYEYWYECIDTEAL